MCGICGFVDRTPTGIPEEPILRGMCEALRHRGPDSDGLASGPGFALGFRRLAIIGLATAGHQAFSANLYTYPSDVFARNAVGSVVGIGGTIGAVGGMSMALFTGYILETTHSYSLLFAICAAAYFVALLAVHLLSPRLATVRIAEGS